MSDDGSPIDVDRLVDTVDYEELLEGTALEGVESDEGSTAEAIGRRLGEYVGRTLGEAVGGALGAALFPALLSASAGDDADGGAGADGDAAATDGETEGEG